MQFLDTETQAQKVLATELFSKWAQIKAMCTDLSTTAEQKTTATTEVFLLTETTSAKYIMYKANVLADFSSKSSRAAR